MATINGTSGNDVLQGGNTGDTINGLAGNDVLIGGTAADSLDGGTGADTMIGAGGNDTYVVDDAGDVITENSGEGTDTVRTSIAYTLSANLENLIATGTGNVALTGNLSANAITGNAGANVLDGGLDTAGGAGDTLTGAGGNDTYIVRDGDVVIVEAADDPVAGVVSGTDTVTVVASQVRTTFSVGAGNSIENIVASDATSTLALNLTGNEFSQTIVGNAGENTLTAGANSAGLPADTLIGLGGSDIYNVVSAATSVVEAEGGGADSVNIVTGATAGNYVYAGAIETINASGVAAGTQINITGGTAAQTITGSAGANRIVGGGGTDTLVGGLGDDTYTVDSLDDVVTEATGAGTGTDRVIAQSSYALAAASNIEVLTAGGTTLSTRTGQGDGTFNLNALNTTVTSNYFVGDNATSQQIWGDAGGNILNGRISAAAGGVVDTLLGGAGSDTYRVYDQNDVVVEDSDGGAFDFIYTSVSYNLATNDTNAAGVTFVDDTAGTGTGNPPQGVTRTIGGAGNYITGPMQIEVLSAADQAATTNINLTGNAYGQIIIGTYGNNVITDGGSLIGTTQYQDQLAGLRGNDTYNVTAQNTTVNENAGEGTDVVNVTLASTSSLFFSLIDAAEVEYVNATGNAFNVNLRGNAFNQVITGNDGNNNLDGNGGQDTLVGGVGSDTYVITSANATNVSIVEYAADDTAAVPGPPAVPASQDTVSTSVSFDLAATNATYVNSAGATVNTGGTIAIEAIVASVGTSTDNINLTGNGAAQILVGNYGNNILNGDNDTVDGNGVQIGTAAGDTLTGLFGDDSYRVYSQNDVVRENGGQGNDVVFTSAAYQLRTGTSVETLTAADQASTTGLTLIGNEFAQSIIGTAGNDTIWGGNGNDTLYGRGGIDVFGIAQVGAANADTLQDFTPGDTIGLYTGAVNGFATATFSVIGASLTADEFIVGTAAADANDYIIYNQASGQLFFDQDGNGTAFSAQLIAQLVPGTGLGFNDFTVLTTAPTTAAAA